jgi:hypothetical protein
MFIAVLPAAMEQVRRKLAAADDNRQMVDILTAVLTDGLPAVEAARRVSQPPAPLLILCRMMIRTYARRSDIARNLVHDISKPRTLWPAPGLL